MGGDRKVTKKKRMRGSDVSALSQKVEVCNTILLPGEKWGKNEVTNEIERILVE